MGRSIHTFIHVSDSLKDDSIDGVLIRLHIVDGLDNKGCLTLISDHVFQVCLVLPSVTLH